MLHMASDYNRTGEAQEIFRAKRKPKNPIKFNIQLNEEQKTAKEQALSGVITALRGKAGSGKSLLAANIAAWALDVARSHSRIGFMPLKVTTIS